MSEITTRFINKKDYDNWLFLYKKYLEFYQTSLSSKELEKVWSWIIEYQSIFCLVAESKGLLVGLAHFREFYRPIKAEKAVYLDDLFVSSEARGKKVGFQLLQALKHYAASQEISLIRWITAQDNVQAMKLYDSIAKKTSWVTYDAQSI